MANLKELLEFVIKELEPDYTEYMRKYDLFSVNHDEVPKWLWEAFERNKNGPNPFYSPIPIDDVAVIDGRMLNAKLDDSYMFGKVVKFMVGNFADNLDAFSDEPHLAIIDCLKRLVELESNIEEIRKIIDHG